MAGRERHILATSAGLVSASDGPYRVRRSRIADYALSLTGKQTPRLCFLTTAGGDNAAEIAAYYAGFAGCDDVIVSNLALFPMPNVTDPAAHLLSQDVIWVSGGSVANLLAVWRVHGLDEVFREAWERGIVLSGVSAGSLCWHDGGTTDSFGVELRSVTNGLGLLPFSNCPHYNSEERRRPTYERLIGDGTLGDGFATDDGVGLHFVGTELREVVSRTSGASAYRVERTGPGEVKETTLTPRLLQG